ncbi:MAG: 30S ribosome-binding factor RbfA [Gemmatimonadota bacterium]|nr:30S ribosome-binding factor RbfA [Gemmatimonadota bacterium]
MRSRSHHRPERVAALVQETLAEMLSSQVKDPRVGFVTVTGVSVSRDCVHAHVRVSVLGDEDEKASAMEGLASAKGYLRTQLARTLTLRVAPELHFILDRGLEHAKHIDRLLNEPTGDESS